LPAPLPTPLVASLPLTTPLLAPLPLPLPVPLLAPLAIESLTLTSCKKIKLEFLTLLTSHVSKYHMLAIMESLENTWDDEALECHVSLGA
jgi:hypothetical protein